MGVNDQSIDSMRHFMISIKCIFYLFLSQLHFLNYALELGKSRHYFGNVKNLGKDFFFDIRNT